MWLVAFQNICFVFSFLELINNYLQSLFGIIQSFGNTFRDIL